MLVIEPLEHPPDAVVRPPGSKSITNRALVLAALAGSPSVLQGALRADDTEAMIEALRALGARIDADGTRLEVRSGVGDRVRAETRIDARLSGTTSRFIAPVAALVGGGIVIDGAPPLRARPMGPILEALVGLGATVEYLGEPGHLPVRIDGTDLSGGAVDVDVSASSQFLSALLLIGPRLEGGLEVAAGDAIAARPFVDLTLGVLDDFGAVVHERRPGRFRVAPGSLAGCEYVVEADATAASYFAAAAAITGGRVRLAGLGEHSRQGDAGFLAVLEAMGATVQRGTDATVVTGGPLRGIDVDLGGMPDTVQTLSAVAVYASSPTRVRGVGFIRGHETDRLAAVVGELRRLGIDASETDDGLTIVPGTPSPGVVATHDDHRMAMSFALLGLNTPGIGIEHPGVVAKTYPGFFDDLETLHGYG